MKSNQYRVIFKCAMAAITTACITRAAAADTLLIDTSQSSFTIGLQIGFDDPDNPGTFLPIATNQGQAENLPNATFPGSVVPGFSDGLSAQLTGSMDVQVSGGVITVGALTNINLLPSGLWQPGTILNGSGSPTPSEIGGYILASLAGTNDLQGILTMNGTQFIVTASGALDGMGNFTDPAGTVFVNTNFSGWAVDPLIGLQTSLDSHNTHGTSISPESGNFSNGVLTMQIFGSALADESGTLPGLEGLFTVTGTIVTLPVPEPCSLALVGIGLWFIGFAKYRRKL